MSPPRAAFTTSAPASIAFSADASISPLVSFVSLRHSTKGIAALSVRLEAPKVKKQPVGVTVTNADGEFVFEGMTVGKYLLTIYRGTTLLYRKEIDNSVTTTFTVPLRSE